MSSTSDDDTIATFFHELAARGPDPRLAPAEGTVRFVLTDGGSDEHWYVTVEKGGAVGVSHKRGVADAGLRIDKSLFAQLVLGTENATAAVLRGACVPEGDLGLL